MRTLEPILLAPRRITVTLAKANEGGGYVAGNRISLLADSISEILETDYGVCQISPNGPDSLFVMESFDMIQAKLHGQEIPALRRAGQLAPGVIFTEDTATRDTLAEAPDKAPLYAMLAYLDTNEKRFDGLSNHEVFGAFIKKVHSNFVNNMSKKGVLTTKRLAGRGG